MYQAVELNVNGKILRGCVRVPERGNGRYPAVCFYHGFTVEKVGLMRLHELFARRCEMAGIACIRFDFYGCGESEGEYEEMRFLDEVEQAKAIYQWAAQQAFVDPKKIFMAGHSLGGAVAGIAAVEKQPKGLLLWSAGNTAYFDISRRAGAIPGEYQTYYDVGGLKLAGEFIEELRKTDVVNESKGYRGRVLLVHGERDEKIPIASAGSYMDMYGGNACLRVIEGADHQFSSIEWKEKVYQYSIDFLKNQIKNA